MPTGDKLWSNPLPSEHCTVHATGDTGLGDLDSDDRFGFLAATYTQGVSAYDTMAGEEMPRQDLLDPIGYSAPVAAALTGNGTPDLSVVDTIENLSVVHAGGSVVWTHEME